MPETIDTREGWLEDAVMRLRPDFVRAQCPLPAAVKVSVGFPSVHATGQRLVALGQCWDATASADNVAQVFITPLLDNPVDVLAVLVHELVHAAIGCEHGHKAPFKRAAVAMGLEGKMTQTTAGPRLTVRLHALSAALGEFPHAKLTPGVGGVKKQTTRMIRVTCTPCEYLCRLTRKMLTEHGAPICPSCGEQMHTDDAPDTDTDSDTND